jgi:hypothetical protein
VGKRWDAEGGTEKSRQVEESVIICGGVPADTRVVRLTTPTARWVSLILPPYGLEARRCRFPRPQARRY